MNRRNQQYLALIIGVITAIGAWIIVALSHPSFWRLEPMALIPPVFAGLLGGAITGLITPANKIRLAVFAGMIVALPAVAFLLRNGFSHFGRNPLLWYWPIWVVPAFSLGGYLSSRVNSNNVG